MKRIAVLLLMAASSVLSQDNDNETKGSFTCTGAGSACDGDFINNGPSFCNEPGMKCCKMPLYCVNGACATNNDGVDCTKDSDCFPTYYGTGLAICDPETKKCRTQYNAGDTCSTSTACYGGMECVNNKCVGFEEDHGCTPLREGTEMTGATGYVCGKGLFCEEGNCTKKADENGECTSDEGCVSGHVCNIGKCKKRFSLADGEECSNSDACGLKSVCHEGKCTKGVEYNRMTCTSDSDCVIDDVKGVCSESYDIFSGSRMCVFHGGASVTCKKKYRKLINCMEKNNCAPTPSSDGNTCSQTKCSSKLLDYFACEENCKRFRQTYGSKCATGTILNYCPTVPTWLKIFLVFAVILVVITILFVVYGIHVHKTKNLAYSEIASSPSSQ